MKLMKKRALLLILLASFSLNNKAIICKASIENYLLQHEAYLLQAFRLAYLGPQLFHQVVLQVAERIKPYLLRSGFSQEDAQIEAEKIARQLLINQDDI